MAWAWRQQIVTSATDRHVLVALANFANADGESVYPTQSRLAKMTGLTDRSVRAAVSRLQEVGVLELIGQRARNVNEYRLHLTTPEPPSAESPSAEAPSGPARNLAAATPEGDSDKPSVNHQQNHQQVEANPAVGEVWAHWKRRRGSARDLSQGASKQIRRALKAGYTAEQICWMIDALLASDWHRERKLLYLSTIFSTKPGGPTFEDQLDGWLERAGKPNERVRQGVPSASNARVSAAKRDVLAAWEFPGDARVAERGLMAADWLAQHGWKIERDSNGKPRFFREDFSA